MLTPENFKTLVGYQEAKDHEPLSEEPLPALVFLLCPRVTTPNPDDWTKNIPSMTNDEVLEKLVNDDPPMPMMSLDIQKFAVVCDKTLDEVLLEASTTLKQLPKFPIAGPFDEQKAKTRIAKNSRRGVGNARIDDVLVYRGSQEVDCCIVIVKRGGRYGMVKQEHFDWYGFVLYDGTKVQV